MRNVVVAGLLALQLLCCQSGSSAQGLCVGQPVQKRIAAGQRHRYAVALHRGDYLELEVLQKGIDLSVSLLGPDQVEIFQLDSPNGRWGPEEIFYVSPRAETLEVRVEAPDKYAQPGDYRLLVKALRQPTPRDRSRADAFAAMTQAARLSGQEALGHFRRAVGIWRRVEEPTQEALTLVRMGWVQLASKQAPQALTCFRDAYRLSRLLNEPNLQLEVLLGIGRVHESQASPQEAEDYKAALQTAQRAGLKVGSALAHHDLAVYHLEHADFEKALQHFNSSNQTWRELGNAYHVADSERNIGDVYIRLGQPQSAMDHFKSAVEFADEAGDLRLKADCMGWIVWASIQQDQLEEALERNSEALQLDRSVDLLQSRGSIYKMKGLQDQRLKLETDAEKMFRLALSTFHEALELAVQQYPPRYQANLLAEIAHVHSCLGEASQAQLQIDRALGIYDQSNAPAPHAFALFVQAQLHRQQGNLKAALANIEKTLQIVRTVRSESKSRDLRISFSSRRHDYSQFYIDLLIRLEELEPGQGYAEKALEAFDQNQALSLTESLLEAQAGIRQSADSEILKQEAKLLERLSHLDWQIISLDRQPDQLRHQPRIEELEAERRHTARQLEDLNARLRASSPRYAELSSPQPLSLTQIQQEILDNQTLLLAYSLGSPRSYLWLVSPSSLQVFPLAPRWQIEKLAQRLIRNSDGEFSKKRALLGILRQLSHLLLDPLKGKLEQKRLVIVGDGPLLFIPFDALPNPTSLGQRPPYTRPLVLDHEIVTIPSASTVAVLRRQAPIRPPATKTLGVLADPVFSREDKRFQEALALNPSRSQSAPAVSATSLSPVFKASNLHLKRLPNSGQEARAILALVPEPERFSAFGFKANREALFGPAGLDQCSIAHLATHGIFHPQNPQFSSIVLSLFDEKLQDDPSGLIRTHEIYRLRMSADLVVLSACETVHGKYFRGEGIVGLTRGFMYAGASRVVVSLWKVDDKATSELMHHFYVSMLRQHLPVSAALRQAKIRMIESDQWEDPYFWAGFILQGDWR